MKTGHNLAPLAPADLPAKSMGVAQMIGPGAVLVGLSIGSGELILWPTIVAEYGPTMAWAPLVGVFLQYWVNQELGRYVLATGESVYTGFARLSGYFVYFFLFISTAQHLAPAWAVASGGVLKALVVGVDGPGETYVWVWVTFLGIAATLFLAKYIYSVIEAIMLVMCVVIVAGLMATVAVCGDTNTWKDVGRGVLNFGFIDPHINRFQFFAALVFAGVGGTGNIFLNYYLRDKSMGMGARMGRIINPFRGEAESVPSTGFIFKPTVENLERWREWFRDFRLEQAVLFWFVTSFTIMLFFVAAAATLYPAGLVPEGFEVAVTQSKMLEVIAGRTGYYIFLLVSFVVLFSTQVAIVDGMARTISDIIYVNFPRAQNRSLSFWYMFFAGAWIVVGCLLAVTQISPLVLLIINACFGGLAMAVYCPLTLVINYRFLPEGVRPDAVSTVFLVVASLVYIFFTVYALSTIVGG